MVFRAYIRLKRNWGKNIFALLCFGIILSLPSCSTNPATGKQIFSGFLTPQQEIELGQKQHDKIIAQYGVIDHPKLSALVSKIGHDLAKETERPDVQYTFTVLDDPAVNAFAVPGGYIYVTKGLLEWAVSAEQVAAVIAHEIGHITARHSAQQVSTGTVAGIGAGILGVITGSSVFQNVVEIGSDLYIKSYSRSHEYEADTLGIRYLSKQNYDTTAMAGFLSQLQRHSHVESQNGAGKIPEYLSTHPSTDKRVERAEELASKAQKNSKQSSPSLPSRVEYYTMLDGLVYGPSPASGTIDNNKFIHIPLDFTYTAPDGYKLINQPQAVIAVGSNNRRLLFDIDRTDKDGAVPQDPLTYITQFWGKKYKWSVSEQFYPSPNISAATAAIQKPDGSYLRLVALKIDKSDSDIHKNKIYRFVYTGPRDLEPEVINSGFKLSTVSSADKITYAPMKIEIEAVEKPTTWVELSENLPGKFKGRSDFLKAINGYDLNSVTAETGLIKTLAK